MRIILRFLILLPALAFLPQNASAQSLPFEAFQDVMDACRADYHRLCPDVIPGRGRVARCLADQEEDISPTCLTAVKFARAVKACTPDYFRFCDGVEPGRGRVARCLADHSDLLSRACYRVVQANTPYLDDWEDAGEDRYAYRKDRYYREDRFYRREDRNGRYDDREDDRDEDEPIK